MPGVHTSLIKLVLLAKLGLHKALALEHQSHHDHTISEKKKYSVKCKCQNKFSAEPPAHTHGRDSHVIATSSSIHQWAGSETRVPPASVIWPWIHAIAEAAPGALASRSTSQPCLSSAPIALPLDCLALSATSVSFP